MVWQHVGSSVKHFMYFLVGSSQHVNGISIIAPFAGVKTEIIEGNWFVRVSQLGRTVVSEKEQMGQRHVPKDPLPPKPRFFHH